MKKNLLDVWEKSILLESSRFNPKRTIVADRNSIERVAKVIREFFGSEYFEIETFDKYAAMENPKESNWIWYMLSSHNSKAINQIVELSDIIKHFKDDAQNLLDSLKHFAYISDLRQFRNYLFELYTYFIFDKNKLKCNKKNFEGDKELEGEVFIDGEACLFECRKLYNKRIEEVKFNMQLVSNISKLFSKSVDPVIVGIQYSKAFPKFKNIVDKEVSQIISKWKSEEFIFPVSKRYFDGELELAMEPYHHNRFEELFESKYKGSNYVLMENRPQDGSLMSTSHHFQTSIHFGHILYDDEIKKYIIDQIKRKRRNRSTSKYKYRIYLFESEIYPGFDNGIIGPKGLSESVIKGIRDYVFSKNTNDIIIIIERNTVSSKEPRIKRTLIFKDNIKRIGVALSRIKFDLY